MGEINTACRLSLSTRMRRQRGIAMSSDSLSVSSAQQRHRRRVLPPISTISTFCYRSSCSLSRSGLPLGLYQTLPVTSHDSSMPQRRRRMASSSRSFQLVSAPVRRPLHSLLSSRTTLRPPPHYCAHLSHRAACLLLHIIAACGFRKPCREAVISDGALEEPLSNLTPNLQQRAWIS